MEKIRLGISACLLGQNVRYDGGHRHNLALTEALAPLVEWVPLCPEVEYGLTVPREIMHLAGDPASPRLVTVQTGIDHTDAMGTWAAARLERLAAEGIGGFILKSRSPSCGLKVKVHTAAGVVLAGGVGLFAAALRKRFPHFPVEEDDRLNDPESRQRFIERLRLLAGRRQETA